MAKRTEKVTAPPAGFKSVEFTVWEPELGEALQGIYIKRQEVNSPGENRENPTFIGHHVKTSDGLFTVAGAVLDTLLEDVPFGTEIWIQYNGSEKRPGGRMMKKFSVAIKE